MDIDLAALPDDVETLQRMVRTLATDRANLTEAQAEIERLRLIVQKLQRSQFGRRAERLDDDQLQLGFEDVNTDIARVEASLPSATVKTQRSRPDRPSLPAHLPREDIRLDLEHQACPCCGGELHVIGETVSEMLDHVPARLRVIRIYRPRYGCRACGTIHQAPAPERPIAKGLASPGLLAHVLIAKYCDHLPLYRQSQIFARHGVEIDRSTLANWVGWSPCRPASPPMCLDQPSCLPTTRRFRYSIPVAAAPKPAACGSMRATIEPGPDPNRRPPFTSTVRIARQSVLPLISRTSVVCCKSTAMLASSG
jgi:transposase